MLDIFASRGDIHTEVAKSVFKVKEPTKPQRQVVKMFNYGLVYGAADATLWKNLRAEGVPMTISDVGKVREMWFKARPKVKSYLDRTLAKAKSDGYIEAPLSGRRYYFYDKVEPSKVYNNPVQMTAADLINQVFPLIDKDLHWPEEGILFQYHDAVIIDTPDPLRGWDILHNRMTQEIHYNGCKANFYVDVEIGKSWQSAKSCTREEAAELARSGGTQGST
jgi:DNA polymerase-1